MALNIKPFEGPKNADGLCSIDEKYKAKSSNESESFTKERSFESPHFDQKNLPEKKKKFVFKKLNII